MARAKTSKKVVYIHQERGTVHERALANVLDAMGERCACCVLITCVQASQDGNMEVEMSFEGDESLAAFLIENASQVFDEKLSQRESQ